MHARIGWQNLRTSEFLDSGNYMLITGTDFNDGAINFSTCHYVERERYEQDRNIQIHNGSILITKDGTLGKVAYVQGLSMPATLNAGVFNVQIKDANNVDEKYLFQYLKAPFLMDYVDKKATGGTIKHLNQSILVDFPVILPQRSEQTLIGAFFQQLDNLITLHQRQPFLHSTPEISLTVQLIHPFYTSSWEQRKLSEIADKVTEKNAGLQYVETFTNSAEFGIISQRDFFDHDIAKLGSLDGYYIVKNEDFVYNPRISTSAPVGPINRNKLGRTGVMSPLYTVFRPHDVDTTYLEHFFKCAYWHSFMNFNGDSGARSDRFSIKDDVFFQMPIPLPYIDEQRKIGELLTRLDHLITLHQRKGKAAVTGCSNDANNSKGVYCKARDFGYKMLQKSRIPIDSMPNCGVHLLCIGL